MIPVRPIFVTREPMRIAALRQLLFDAGIEADPVVIYPEEIERATMDAAGCLILIDGDSPPPTKSLAHLRRYSSGARIVIWTGTLAPELLLATIECGLDGLISSDLPREEAAEALARICGGERILRFDSAMPSSKRMEPPATVAAAPSFDAQWMLHGAQADRREK
jgi:DNA-binding NarL/FixJ family response regulator